MNCDCCRIEMPIAYVKLEISSHDENDGRSLKYCKECISCLGIMILRTAVELGVDTPCLSLLQR